MTSKTKDELGLHKSQISFKTSQFPYLISLWFCLTALLLILTSEVHWDLINNEIGNLFGADLDYVAILTGIITGFVIYLGVILVTGLRFRRILHHPLNLILTLLISIFFVAFLTILVSLNMRVRLDYIWFSAGQAHYWMYFAVLALYTLTWAVLLLKRPSFLKQNSGGKESKPRGHPKLVFISLLLSLAIAIYMITSLLTAFSRNFVFWDNIFILYRYIDGFEFLYFLFGGCIVGWMVYLIILKRKMNGQLLKKRLIKIGVLIFPTFIILSMVLIGSVIQVNLGYGLQAVYPLIIIAALSCIPLTFYSVRILKIHLSMNLITKNRFFVTKEKRRTFGIISLLLFGIFSVFLVPSIASPPDVDLPAATSLQYLNNTYIAFQNGIMYPSFDFQPSYSENGTRNYYSLNGDWKFAFENSGIWTGSDLSLKPRTAKILAEIATGWESLGFNASGWENITVPSAFNRMDHPIAGYHDAQGICYYRRNFTLADLGISEAHLIANNVSIFLKFLKANYITDVWVDGEYLGYHEGGFNSFCFDVTSLLQTVGGVSHLLAVRIDTGGWNTELFPKLVPGFADWFNYAGLVEEVYIEVTPRCSVVRADMQVTQLTPQSSPPHNGSIDVNVDICVNIPQTALVNSSGPASLSLSFSPLIFPNQASMFNNTYWHYANKSPEGQPDIISGAVQKNILTTGVESTAYAIYRFTLSLDNVSFWTNKQPALYMLEVNLSVAGITAPFFDRFLSQIGFRELTVNGTQLLLNDAPIFLAGNNIHQEAPEMGRTVTAQRIWDDLLLLKNNLSTNLIRSHYTLNPLYYLYGDRLGLAFWEEAPVYWFNDVTLLETMVRGTAKSMFLEMVYRDMNRPSIFFWSVANEPWSEDLLTKYLKDFRDLQELIDPGRILGYAMPTPSQVRCPPFADMEMMTANWVDDPTVLTTQYPNKPLLLTEYGRPIDQRADFYLENPQCIGFIYWIGISYYSNYHLDFNYGWSGSGMYDKDRVPHADVPLMQELYENLTKNNP